MKTKTHITVLLVAILLISCAPAATSVSPTETAVPTVTVTVPAPTKTPTQVPATPTEAGLSKDDYLAKSENIFPMLEVDGLAEFSCLGDFDNIIYQHHTLPDETIVKAWLPCEDGGVQFLIPLFLENKLMSYVVISMRPNVKRPNKITWHSDEAVRRGIKGVLDALGLTGKAKVKVLIGENSKSVLGEVGDPFPAIFAATGWDKTIQEFILTGDPNKLPSVDGLPGRVLYGVRIKGSN